VGKQDWIMICSGHGAAQKRQIFDFPEVEGAFDKRLPRESSVLSLVTMYTGLIILGHWK
jgi:hypothetical protein